MLFFSEEELLAKLSVIPLEVSIHGKAYAMGGISGVATYPEHRRSGYIRQLMQESLKLMKDAGQLISYLAPFSIGFYRKFGWELLANQIHFTIQKDQLPKRGPIPGSLARVPIDHPHISELYQSYAQRNNGLLLRSESWWQKLNKGRKDAKAAVYTNSSGEPRAYLIYTLKDFQMKIKEYIYLDEESRRAMFVFISQHDSMLNTVSGISAYHAQLSFLLDEPAIKQELKPYFMARIVDVKPFLEAYPFKETSEALFLHIEDHIAPWNEGTYQLTWTDAGVKVQVIDGTDANEHPTKRGLQLSINTLTTMLLCYQRPTFLHDSGKVEGPPAEIEQWERLIPRDEPEFLDFFLERPR